MPVVTVLPCLKNIFETYWNRTELVQNRDPMVASRAGTLMASSLKQNTSLALELRTGEKLET